MVSLFLPQPAPELPQPLPQAAQRKAVTATGWNFLLPLRRSGIIAFASDSYFGDCSF
jgi:hypothetical protein